MHQPHIVTHLRDKFEEEGVFKNVSKNHSRRPLPSISSLREREIAERFYQSPRKSVLPVVPETKVPKSNVHRISKRAQWKRYIPS
ncbi:hypothetical protein TNCV_1176121 [Trichonephila clavipes]|nr:hypothetical protein TNCV_1176121 [Trichonephila clavipes]